MSTERIPLDPQEHVDAIYRCAGLIQSHAKYLHDFHTLNGVWGQDHNIKAAHAAMLANAAAAESAAEAFIDLQTERDELLATLVGMVQEPQPLGIDRESYQTAIALVIKHHDDVDNPEAWAARRAAA